MERTVPDKNGKPIEMENNQPPMGGPAILPKESKEDSSPETLPCPVLDLFVSSAESAGLMNPFPTPKIVRKIADVQKPEENRMNANPTADMMSPNWMTMPSPYFLLSLPTKPPWTIALPNP